MAISKTFKQPEEYLKVQERSLIKQVEGGKVETTDENGNVTITKLPGIITFIVGATLYASHQDRIDAETNEWVQRKELSFEFDFVPDLPENWEPIDPANIEAEKMITKGYLAIKTLPEYANWVDYQP